jgi:hypothetical protein
MPFAKPGAVFSKRLTDFLVLFFHQLRKNQATYRLFVETRDGEHMKDYFYDQCGALLPKMDPQSIRSQLRSIVVSNMSALSDVVPTQLPFFDLFSKKIEVQQAYFVCWACVVLLFFRELIFLRREQIVVCDFETGIHRTELVQSYQNGCR